MRHTTVLLAPLLALLPLVAPAARADFPNDPAAWAPSDALVFVGVTDVDQLWTSFKKTAAYRMLEDPDIAGAVGKMDRAAQFIDGFKKRLAELLETEPTKLENPFGGPMAFYIALPEGGDPNAAYGALVAGVSNKERMKSYYEAAQKRFRKAATRHEAISFGDASIDEFTTEKKVEEKSGTDEPEINEEDLQMPGDNLAMSLVSGSPEEALDKLFSLEHLPEKFATCFTGDRLVIASDADHVKQALRQEKAERTLRDADDYKAIGRQFKSAGPIRFLVNVPALVSLATREADEDGRKFIAAMGFKSFGSVIGHVEYGGEKFDSRCEVLAPMSGERIGLAKILSMKNRPLAPPASLSADTAMFGSAALNVGAMLDEVEKIMRQIDPDAAEEMRKNMTAAPLAEGETVNVRAELIDHLREPVSFAMSFSKPYNAASARVLLSVGHGNRDAVQRFLTKLVESGGMPVSPRDLGGATVYDIAFGGVSLAVGGDAVLFGSKEAVESGLAGRPSEPLAESPAFRRVGTVIDREAWGMFYFDARKLMEAAIAFAQKKEELQNAMFSNIAAMMAAAMIEQLTEELGDETLKNGEKLLKYQSTALGTVSTTSDGLLFTLVDTQPGSEDK